MKAKKEGTEGINMKPVMVEEKEQEARIYFRLFGYSTCYDTLIEAMKHIDTTQKSMYGKKIIKVTETTVYEFNERVGV